MLQPFSEARDPSAFFCKLLSPRDWSRSEIDISASGRGAKPRSACRVRRHVEVTGGQAAPAMHFRRADEGGGTHYRPPFSRAPSRWLRRRRRLPSALSRRAGDSRSLPPTMPPWPPYEASSPIAAYCRRRRHDGRRRRDCRHAIATKPKLNSDGTDARPLYIAKQPLIFISSSIEEEEESMLADAHARAGSPHMATSTPYRMKCAMPRGHDSFRMRYTLADDGDEHSTLHAAIASKSRSHTTLAGMLYEDCQPISARY